QDSKLYAFIGTGYSEQDPHKLDFTNQQDQHMIKSLFVSDTDKRKFFELRLNLVYRGPIDVGSFSSSRVKVISKPSKKKERVKTTDCKSLCIASGSKVALFKRARGQLASTRYLHVDNNTFTVSESEWSAFKIYLCPEGTDDEANKDDDYQTETDEGYVHYGSVIKLVDSASGISLPKMIIRKIDDTTTLLEHSEEPVSQLHKCAFEVI
ncbi:hypothetical protein PMAYCL1PPCAC_28530, partial [Pristionchus mayeri]